MENLKPLSVDEITTLCELLDYLEDLRNTIQAGNENAASASDLERRIAVLRPIVERHR